MTLSPQMELVEEKLRRLGRCAKPVLFETDFDEAPYAGKGTLFFVKTGSDVFLVSTRHAFGETTFEKLLVFPNTETENSIPFTHSFAIYNRDPEDTDYSDLVLARVDISSLLLAPDSNMTVLDLDKVSDSWGEDPSSHRYIVFGYPAEAGSIDYEKCKILDCQHVLVGEFAGYSPSSQCFQLNITDSNGISNFDGLSGSPVLSFRLGVVDNIHPNFCGMVIRGTRASGRIHFLDSLVIKRAIELALEA